MATKVLDIDLVHVPAMLDQLAGYDQALALVRWRGAPLGTVRLPVHDGRISAAELWQAATGSLSPALKTVALEAMLPAAPASSAALPSASIIICTRNRTDDLRRCLDALCAGARPEVEIIVVDNAPSDERTAELTADYPVRYVREMQPGLNWARSRGAREAHGEILIYTDDDVVVDRDWIDAIRAPFTLPQIAAVSGLVLPLELETAAQELFEQYGGFGRGFRRREFTSKTLAPVAAANVGAGANMALRRQLVTQLKLFEVELDGGTPALSGGDTYAFYRLLSLGYRLVYEPRAIVWHRHRRTLAELRAMLRGYSVGTFVFLLRCLLLHGDAQAIYAGWSWLREHHLRQLWRGLRHHPDALPLDLTLAELRGVLQAPRAYRACRRRERAAPRSMPAVAPSTAGGTA
jgi:GT2 family glycosyltransferase